MKRAILTIIIGIYGFLAVFDFFYFAVTYIDGYITAVYAGILVALGIFMFYTFGKVLKDTIF